MKILYYIFLALSALSLALGLLAKFILKTAILGIAPAGYLNVTMILLLFAINFALLKLMKK